MRRIFAFGILFLILSFVILTAKSPISGGNSKPSVLELGSIGDNLPKAVWTVNLVSSYGLSINGVTSGFGGLTYDWRQDALWISHWGHNKMYQINKSNGNLILDIAFQGSYPTYYYGLAFAHTSTDLYKMYVSTGSAIYKMNFITGYWSFYRDGKGHGLGLDVVNDALYGSGSENKTWWARPSQTGPWNPWIYYGMGMYPSGVACSYSGATASDKIFVVWATTQGADPGVIEWFQNNNGVPGNKVISYYLPNWMTNPQDCAFDGRYLYVINWDLPNPDKIAVLDPFTPPTPTNFKAEAVHSWQKPIDLTWDNVPREQGYRIYRSTVPNPPPYQWGLRITKGVDETTATDYCAAWSWVYYYYLVSYNQWGESNHSPIVQETTWVAQDSIKKIEDHLPSYLKLTRRWNFNVYDSDSIVWYTSNPTLHPQEPTIRDDKQINPAGGTGYWSDNDGLPPAGYYVTYRIWGYTHYHPEWNPIVSGRGQFYHSPDPPIVSTADTFATAYSNTRKIIVDSGDRMHITYTSNDTVYYIYSDDYGATYSTPAPVGNGRYPGLALDSNNTPSICWTREYDSKEYMINYSTLTSSGWTEPVKLLHEYKKKSTPASFDIDKKENIAHITWADFSEDANKWLIYKGQFSLLDTTPQVEPVPYDSAVEMTPESPNYLCDQDKVEGYLLWEKDGDIYAGVEYENGVVNEIVNLSSSSGKSIHPNLSKFGDSLYAVWQEDNTLGSSIFFTKRSTEMSQGWDEPEELTDFPEFAELPVCVGPYVFASARIPEKGSYDIYGLRKDEFGDVSTVFKMTTTKTDSRYPAVYYTQHFPRQRLYVIGTEDAAAGKAQPYVLGKCVVETAPIPIKAANLGFQDASPYTVQREGYKVFGFLAYQKVDYHPQELIYHFSGLNPSKRYKLKLVFYYKPEAPVLRKWRFKVKVGGHPIGTIGFKPDRVKPAYFEKWIPISAYQSGSVDLSIEKMKGDYAVCSEVFLYEYEKAGRKDATQFAENRDNLSQKSGLISLKPNPFNGSTKISFLVSDSKNVSLKIYDTSGRLCRTIMNKRLDAGSYTCTWNGKNANGKILSSGVYFSVLRIGDRKLVKKLVKVQ